MKRLRSVCISALNNLGFCVYMLGFLFEAGAVPDDEAIEGLKAAGARMMSLT